jgi:hypothetical protein
LDELRAAYVERRAPAFDRKSRMAWAKSVRRLCWHGQLDVGEHGVRHLRQAFPGLPLVQTLYEMFDRMPPADGSQSEFSDDWNKDVQIAARPGAELAILLFCGGGHRLGLPLSMIHRWTGRLPATLIYLRDLGRTRYLGGLASLGPDLQSTLMELRRLIASLGARRIACYGNSGGVFPALYYGQALGANAVMCLAGKTNHMPEFNAYAPGKAKYDENFVRDYASFDLDARRIYERAPSPPSVCIVYGQNNWDDRRHAEHMGELDCVKLSPVENYDGHDVVLELIRRDEYSRALDWLLSAGRRPSSAGVRL